MERLEYFSKTLHANLIGNKDNSFNICCLPSRNILSRLQPHCPYKNMEHHRLTHLLRLNAMKEKHVLISKLLSYQSLAKLFILKRATLVTIWKCHSIMKIINWPLKLRVVLKYLRYSFRHYLKGNLLRGCIVLCFQKVSDIHCR